MVPTCRSVGFIFIVMLLIIIYYHSKEKHLLDVTAQEYYITKTISVIKTIYLLTDQNEERARDRDRERNNEGSSKA